MAWVESHTVLIRHRKVAETARKLRLRRSYLIGHLHVLWHAALEQQEDGDLSDWSDDFISENADFPGDAPQFVKLLQDHKWLDGKLIHDWLDYAGKFLISKYATSNRARLVEIWAKHGRDYGSNRKATEKQPESNSTTPNPPTLTHPPANVSSDENLRSFATGWITQNCQQFIKSSETFHRLLIRLGKKEAVGLIEEALKNPAVGNPFPWLEKKLDNKSAFESAKAVVRKERFMREDA